MVTGSLTRKKVGSPPPVERVTLTLTGNDAHNFVVFLKAVQVRRGTSTWWRDTLSREYSKNSRGSGVIGKVLDVLEDK